MDTKLDFHRITGGFIRAFPVGVTCKQGTLTLPDTSFGLMLRLAYATIVATSVSVLAVSFLDFSL